MGAKSKPNDSASRYEAQKRRDWNTFSKYLNNHQPPLPKAKCSDVHVVEFCKHLDQFGKTKVHIPGCQYYGRPNPNTSPESQCSCPLKQAWGSLDSLIGRLRAAYEENGGPPESNPFGARAVHGYLRGVREAQAKARGIVKKKRKEQSGITSSMVPLDQSSFHWLEERTETGMGSEETTNTIQNNVTSDVQMHVQISASKDQLSKGAQPNEPVVSHSNHMVEYCGTSNGKIQPILSRVPFDQSSFHWVEERTETGKGSEETNNTIPNNVSTDVQMHVQISASKDQLSNGAKTNDPVVSHSNHVLEYFGTYNGKIQSILSNVPLDQSSFHWVEERTETGKDSEETNNTIQNNVSSDVHMHVQISTSKDQLLNGAKPNEPVVSHSNHVLEHFGTYNGKIQPIPSISSRERERMNEENKRDEGQRALEREQSRIRSRRRRERMTEEQRVQERERRQFHAKMKKASMDDRQRALERERVRLRARERRQKIREVDKNKTAIERERERQRTRARERRKKMTDDQKSLERERQRLRARERGGCMNSGNSMRERRERRRLLARKLRGDLYSGESEQFHEHEERRSPENEHLTEGGQGAHSMHQSSADHDLAIQNASNCPSINDINQDIIHMQEHVQEGVSRMDGHTSTISLGMEPNCVTEGRTDLPQIRAANIGVNVECEIDTCQNDEKNENSCQTSSVGLGISACSLEPGFGTERTTEQADQNNPTQGEVNHSIRSNQEVSQGGCQTVSGKRDREKLPVKKLNSKNIAYVHNSLEGGGITYNRERSNRSFLEMLKKLTQPVLQKVYEPNSVNKNVDKDDDRIMWDIEHGEYYHVASGLRYNPVTDLYFKNFNATYGLFYKLEKGKLEIMKEGEEGDHNKYLCKDCEVDALTNLEPSLIERVIEMLEQKAMEGYHQRALEMWSQRKRIRDVDDSNKSLERQQECQLMRARKCSRNMNDKQKLLEGEQQRFRGRQRSGGMNSGKSMCERKERQQLLARQLNGDTYSGECELQGRTNMENEDLLEGRQETLSMHPSSTALSFEMCNKEIEKASRMDGDTSTINVGLEPNCRTEGRASSPQVTCENVDVNVECEANTLENDGENDNSRRTSSVGLGISGCSVEPDFEIERTVMQADQDVSSHIDVEVDVDHSKRAHQADRGDGWHPILGKHARKKMPVKKSKLNSKNTGYVHNDFEGGGVTYSREENNFSSLEMLMEASQLVLEQVCEQHSEDEEVEEDVEIEEVDDEIMWDIEHEEYHHVASGLRYNPVTDLYFKNFTDTYGLFYKCKKGKLEIVTEGEEGFHNKFLSKDCEGDGLNNLEPRLVKRVIRMLKQKSLEDYSGVGE